MAVISALKGFSLLKSVSLSAQLKLFHITYGTSAAAHYRAFNIVICNIGATTKSLPKRVLVMQFIGPSDMIIKIPYAPPTPITGAKTGFINKKTTIVAGPYKPKKDLYSLTRQMVVDGMNCKPLICRHLGRHP